MIQDKKLDLQNIETAVEFGLKDSLHQKMINNYMSKYDITEKQYYDERSHYITLRKEEYLLEKMYKNAIDFVDKSG